MAEALVIDPEVAVADLAADLPADEPEELLPGAPDQAEDESAPDEEADPYEGLSPEEIVAKAREGLITAEEAEASRKEALRRQREAIDNEQRTRAAFEAADRKLREDAVFASQQGVAQFKQRLAEAIENGDVDDAFLDKELRDAYAGASLVAFDQLPRSIDVAFREAGIPNGIESFPAEAKAAFHRARADRDFGTAMKVALNAARTMQHEWTLRWAQEQAEQAQGAEAQAAAAAKKLQSERNGAKAPVAPSGGRGKPGASIKTEAEADFAYAEGEIDTSTYKALRRKFGVDG